jgi:hypothetical protein
MTETRQAAVARPAARFVLNAPPSGLRRASRPAGRKETARHKKN